MILPPLLKIASPPTLRTTPDLVLLSGKFYCFNFVPICREDFLNNSIKKMILYEL
jgi:hypothetical protein